MTETSPALTARVRSTIARINASYWFFPALFSILAIALSLLTIHLDRTVAADLISVDSPLAPARPEGASTLLQVIAATTIGVAATVFSITIAAVAFASGTYGPRLLTNFMEDRGNQLSLATFIGTFLYAVMVLRAVRTGEEGDIAMEGVGSALPGFVPQLSLLVATGLMLASIAVLVFFLNHIPASIRINTVLEGIGQRLIEQIRRRFPDEGSEPEQDAPPKGEPVPVGAAGYVEIIDYNRLDEIADEAGATIVMTCEAGDFLHPPMALAEFSGPPMTAAHRDDVQSCFVFSGLRTPTQDLRFLLDELVEIALRALSPGINDPFTATTALHWLGAATAELGSRQLRHLPNRQDRDFRGRVMPIYTDFATYLGTGFGAVRSAAATSHTACMAMFESLASCGGALRDASRRTTVREEGDRLFEQAKLALAGPDLDEVRTMYRRFREQLAAA